ncbi:sigma-70 family RNA polymerase sigma factor [Pigmentiphaga aceris]|uniref:Sigma-70 family RNA polymerase sigma factor n=1 Tax=Pigmentiphaga aceris TaxID=1940612 RepID=A0A5C0AYG3_9BURK|nr:sigma-70 family RNA polymerase sigma factor [Pigmentiphaga aceris]QEI06634.1 sigma-70 family RNA polymerase sigma factor [Pigmentiphaga aceris]
MSSSPTQDSALVATLSSRYGELVEHLRGRFGDKAFAREVVHDVCIRVLEKPPTEPVRTPMAFLRHVAMHLAIDRRRAQRTQAEVLEFQDDPRDVGGAASYSVPELAVAFRQRETALLHAVRGLPPRSQDVFILTQLYHMPQSAVAEQLGISRGMVARHLARAYEDLAPILHEGQ